jgi:uncharacterized LabA/DUF88 family protein
MFYTSDKVQIFIDGYSLMSATRTLGYSVDYKRLRDHFAKRGVLVRLNYYTTVRDDSDGDVYVSTRGLLDWLSYNGYTVVAKPFRVITTGDTRKFKGSITLELAVDALRACDTCNHLVLFVSDGDYAPLVQEIKRKGVRVTIIGSLDPMNKIADSIRREADEFIDLADMRPLLEKPNTEEA